MEAPPIKQAALQCIQDALLACLVVAVASAWRHCRDGRGEARKRRSAGTSTRSALVDMATGLGGAAMDAVRRPIEARSGRDAQEVTQEGDAYLVEARLKHRKQAEVQSARRTPKLQSDW